MYTNQDLVTPLSLSPSPSLSLSLSPSAQAFDHLLALELLVPVVEGVSTGRQRQMREYLSVQLVLTREQVTRAVENYPNCPTDLIRWASSQAVM